MQLRDEKNMRKRPRVYLAGPLFSDAERAFNANLATELEKWADVYLPQRDGGLMSEMVQDGVHPRLASHRVFQLDMEAIRDVDYLIAILDGRTIDEGVAFELGTAFAQSKRCIGLQTDSRRLAPWGNNPMVTGALDTVFTCTDALIQWLSSEVMEAVASTKPLHRGSSSSNIGSE